MCYVCVRERRGEESGDWQEVKIERRRKMEKGQRKEDGNETHTHTHTHTFLPNLHPF